MNNEKLLKEIFVAVDIETTGLDCRAGDKIVEIAAVKIENGQITKKF